MQTLLIEDMQTKIYLIRDEKVMLDSDLAKVANSGCGTNFPRKLYQVETKVLNQAIKRNIKRFPSDFMFELTKDEKILIKI